MGNNVWVKYQEIRRTAEGLHEKTWRVKQVTEHNARKLKAKPQLGFTVITEQEAKKIQGALEVEYAEAAMPAKTEEKKTATGAGKKSNGKKETAPADENLIGNQNEE